MSDVVVGNLDCEVAFERAAGRSVANASGAAVRVAADLATLLRVAAGPEVVLWTPAPVEPTRMIAAPGLPAPRLASGPVPVPGPAGRLLAWAETPEVERLRRRIRDGSVEPSNSPDASLLEALWAVRPSAANVSVRVNHRGFASALERELETPLPGCARIDSIAVLHRHLDRLDRRLCRRWVLKAPFSTAGRKRLFGTRAELEPHLVQRVSGMLEQHGELYFEPFVARVEDFGTTGLVEDDGPVRLRTHRLVVDERGRFRGVSTECVQDERVLSAARSAGDALSAAGYRGAFGVDAFLYDIDDGETRLRPMVEINARVTFGHVLRLLADRLRAAGAASPGDSISLFVGAPSPTAPSVGRRIPLLAPSPTSPTAAWADVGGNGDQEADSRQSTVDCRLSAFSSPSRSSSPRR